MGMSDAQFKAFLRVALRDLTEALQAATPEEKDAIIKALADDFQTRSGARKTSMSLKQRPLPTIFQKSLED